jgi:hypothetical protein
MGLTGCPKLLVNIYKSALLNIPEQQRSQFYDMQYHCILYSTDQKPHIPMQGMTFFSQNDLCLTNLGISLPYHISAKFIM